jgi:hypothetical protein
MGGFFKKGMRWPDYLEQIKEYNVDPAYFERIREAVLATGLRQTGDFHQNSEEGCPVFDDGTSGTFSMRAWGDLMAAIWSTAEDKDYEYMDFYY